MDSKAHPPKRKRVVTPLTEEQRALWEKWYPEVKVFMISKYRRLVSEEEWETMVGFLEIRGCRQAPRYDPSKSTPMTFFGIIARTAYRYILQRRRAMGEYHRPQDDPKPLRPLEVSLTPELAEILSHGNEENALIDAIDLKRSVKFNPRMKKLLEECGFFDT